MSKAEKKLEKEKDALLMTELKVDAAELKRLKKKLAKVQGTPERGIETWFRLASKNLYTRRQIVDTKSNILVTVNAIIISVVLGSLYPRLGEDSHMIFAVVPLVLTNLASIAYAIFATRPKLLAKGAFVEEDIHTKKAGLMTFDDFFKVDEDTYQAAVNRVMEDREFLYQTITKDVYRLGIDLNDRYRFIRIAYNIFLIGIIVSAFMFGLCHALF